MFRVATFTITLCILSFLFFFRLGATALQSYDEAWYAAIARSITQTGNIFALTYNGEPFVDHPPAGFALMATSMKILGESEFSVRFTAALFGLGSLILIMLIGKRMVNIWLGVSASLILLSSMWFMLRARSGNLDVLVVFWALLSIFAAQRAGKQRAYWFVMLAALSLTILTKTMLGLALIPLTLLILIMRRPTLSRSDVYLGVGIFILITAPWYIFSASAHPDFLIHHFVTISSRGESNHITLAALSENALYIQSGIGKWFKPLIASIVLAPFAWWLTRKKFSKPLVLIWGGLLVFAVPFLFSSQSEVWHFIPAYPFFALSIAFAAHAMIHAIPWQSHWKHAAATLAIALIAGMQFVNFSNLLYQTSSSADTERAIAQKAGSFNKKIYLMDTFLPSTVYYSGQNVVGLHWDPQAYQKLTALLLDPKTDAVFIIHETMLDTLKQDGVPAETIATEGQYRVIR